jgi:hypothetical protein
MDFVNIPDEPVEINHEDDSEQNINISNNVINHHHDRYIEIIKLMELNENINYPINIIINGIIDLYTNKADNTVSTSKHYKNINFRTDPISKKIYKYIFCTEGDHMYPVSIISITRLLRRLQRNHAYNKYIIIDKNNIDKNNKNENKNNTLGFNYSNLRWLSLESYDI